MKTLIVFIAILFICAGCSEQMKCENFKTGTFIYTDPDMSQYEIRRTESKQIETDLKTGMEIHCSIEWKSACEYVLKYERFENTEVDFNYMIGREMSINILEINGDVFTCHLKSENSNEQISFKRKK